MGSFQIISVWFDIDGAHKFGFIFAIRFPRAGSFSMRDLVQSIDPLIVLTLYNDEFFKLIYDTTLNSWLCYITLLIWSLRNFWRFLAPFLPKR